MLKDFILKLLKSDAAKHIIKAIIHEIFCEEADDHHNKNRQEGERATRSPRRSAATEPRVEEPVQKEEPTTKGKPRAKRIEVKALDEVKTFNDPSDVKKAAIVGAWKGRTPKIAELMGCSVSSIRTHIKKLHDEYGYGYILHGEEFELFGPKPKVTQESDLDDVELDDVELDDESGTPDDEDNGSLDFLDEL